MTDAECRAFTDMVMTGIERSLDTHKRTGNRRSSTRALLSAVTESVKTAEVWIEERSRQQGKTFLQRCSNEQATPSRSSAT